jgi:hypothetical protein
MVSEYSRARNGGRCSVAEFPVIAHRSTRLFLESFENQATAKRHGEAYLLVS